MITARKLPNTVSALGFTDYLLGWLGTLLPLNSLGLAIGNFTVGLFFIGGATIGFVVSYLLQLWIPGVQKIKWDGMVYLAVALIALFAAVPLNTVLPEEGIPRELRIAGVMAWLLMFGSFTLWRDATILFQAIPGLALFGLVGAFDTYIGSPIAFYFFLIFWGALFIRVHTRNMMRFAQSAGYEDVRAIKEGPWRTMAGPRLAVFSAIGVGLVSLVFGPLVKEGTHTLASAIQIPIQPNRRSSQTPQTPLGILSIGNDIRIGQGERTLTENVVYNLKIDQPRHLRTATYVTYTKSGWSTKSNEEIDRIEETQNTNELRAEMISDPEKFVYGNYQIEVEVLSLSRIPVPGEVTAFTRTINYSLNSDGTLEYQGRLPRDPLAGSYAVPDPSITPQKAGSPDQPKSRFLGLFLSKINIPSQVSELAQSVTEARGTDYEKALAIKQEIEKRCTYNLKAEKTPTEKDPVEHFLFGEKREGYCDLFASSMVLMARSIGIPARVATGWYPNHPIEGKRGWYEVRDSDAHMWAELYFEGVGWIPFDPTEGAPSVEGSGRGDSTVGKPWYQSPALLMSLNIVIACSLIFAVGYSAVFFVRARGSRDMTKILFAEAYFEFQNALEWRSGKLKKLAETPDEYFVQIKDQLGVQQAEATRINQFFVRHFYGPGDIPMEEVAKIQKEVSALARLLRKKNDSPSRKPA